MAIGSGSEIGTSFKICKDYTKEDWEKWWQYMRDNWSEYLQAGYAVLVHKKEGNPFYDIDARKKNRLLKQEKND
jgi:predicted GNAT superfamily acetyltransferase